MNKAEQNLILLLTELSIKVSASNKEVEILRKENEFLKELLIKQSNKLK